ncbi:MAG: peptide chain release factor H [Stappiaceae bacterium]
MSQYQKPQAESVRLLITSGSGPAECRIAVRMILKRLNEEASAQALDVDCTSSAQTDKHGPPSAVVCVHGATAEIFAARWIGTIQWICQSPVRPQHKRRNWYAGIVKLSADLQNNTSTVPTFDRADIRFETFRAGGPGGQHQNTTDSAVRATHVPTNISVVVRDQRSQHRNKQMAVSRLETQLALREIYLETVSRQSEHGLHAQLERGNPKRRFKGRKFIELV